MPLRVCILLSPSYVSRLRLLQWVLKEEWGVPSWSRGKEPRSGLPINVRMEGNQTAIQDGEV